MLRRALRVAGIAAGFAVALLLNPLTVAQAPMAAPGDAPAPPPELTDPAQVNPGAITPRNASPAPLVVPPTSSPTPGSPIPLPVPAPGIQPLPGIPTPTPGR